MTRFAVEPLYGSIWVAVAAGIAIVAVIALVTPPTEDPKRRKWLMGLRSVAAIVLLLAAMRPTLVRTDNRPAPATLVIAVDTSRSMTLPDGDGSDRWTSQLAAATDLLRGVAKLDQSLDVRLLTYDSDSQSIGEAMERGSIASLAAQLEDQDPDGDATDLGRAMQGSIDAAAGKPLAGVVLLGDGTQTATADSGDQAASDAVAAIPGVTIPGRSIAAPGNDSRLATTSMPGDSFTGAVAPSRRA